MFWYTVRRALAAIPTLIALTVVAFLLTTAARGDPALIALLEAGVDPTPEDVAQMREQLGLNAPLPVRYARWVVGVVTAGDLGRSFLTRRPVSAMLQERVAPTLVLGGVALVVSTVLGVGFGVIAAWWRRLWLEAVVRIVVVVLASIPSFWVAISLIVIAGEQLRLLPVAGYGTWQHLILPVTALALGPIAITMRLTRGRVLDILSDDYVRTARAKGVAPLWIALRHVLPNALLPVVALLGVRLGHVLAGAVIIESIFAWPGMGTVLITAISGRDLPVIGGYVLVIGVLVIASNFLVDLVAGAIDPRVRVGEQTA
ncbi:MAG: ABC transporter permease [Dehalococcoidia bacterium]|nr:ABC transporter permease [Dehalococcoidia bacterium]